jgi:hypothetical protein
MRKYASFTLGLLLGTVIATAWANYSVRPLASAAIASAAMNPFDLMTNRGTLPVQGHVDAF